MDGKLIHELFILQPPFKALPVPPLGDLDTTKRTDYEAMTEALEARFGSQNHTEMCRTRLRCRVRGREKMLLELS